MIVLESVSKRYGSKIIIHDLSFTVGKGEIVGFLGPNGAGKTTTMRMIAGVTAATFGRVTVAGYDMATQNADATGMDIAGYFSEGHGVGTFARDGSNVYHCYSSYARGTEFLMGYYAILDRTPKGRDENGEMWLRRHDEYDA